MHRLTPTRLAALACLLVPLAFVSAVRAQTGVDGVLLAGTTGGELVRIDLAAGTATLIGDAGSFDGRALGWTDIAFDAAGGLFAASSRRSELPSTCFGFFATGECAHLYRIDPGTGLVLSRVGDTGVQLLSDVEFDGDGALRGSRFADGAASGQGGLVEIDPDTAAAAGLGLYGANPHAAGNLENGGLALHPITGELWAIESAASTASSIFRVDPATGLALGPVVRLGIGGVPTPDELGFDSLEILPDGRFFATRGRGFGELYRVVPEADPGSGLAEVTLVPLDVDPAIAGSINGLTVKTPRRIDQDVGGIGTVGPGDLVVVTGGATVNANVRVDGGTLIVDDGTIDGNVRVRDGGTADFDMATVNGNVQVRDGSTASFTDSTVDGNLQVRDGASLAVEDSTVSGNFSVRDTSPVTVAGATVEGNLQARGGAVFTLDGSTVDGNLSVRDTGTVTVTGNGVDGNARITGNTDVTVTGNTISGNLTINGTSGTCTGNGGNNTVSGSVNPCP